MNYATVPAQTSLMIMECIRFHTIYNNKASGTLPMLKRRMILCTKDWFPGLFASLVDGSSKFYDLPPLRVREDYRNLGSIKTGIFVGGHPRNVLLTHLAPDKKNITTTTPNNPKIPTNDPYRLKKKKTNSNFDGVQSDRIFWRSNFPNSHQMGPQTKRRPSSRESAMTTSWLFTNPPHLTSPCGKWKKHVHTTVMELLELLILVFFM